jgi:hypothetical protein
MIGITLTTDQIRNAPPEVRRWIEHQVMTSLGLAADAPVTAQPVQAAHLVACSVEEAAHMLAQIDGVLPAVNVFFEFARPGISFGQPAMLAFRLIDILHHARLQNIEQVMAALDTINQAFAQVRHDASARFCGFDNEGHVFVAPETQRSIAALWQSVIAKQTAALSQAA